MKKTLISLATMAALAATTPAYAETKSVDYRDLNLASPQGQAALQKRLDHAAREVCGLNTKTLGTRIRSSDAQKCYIAAKKQAASQMTVVVNEERLGG
ncbi:UrcA family protein [Altererythrobacter sp. RZ02]|uniref:UrcA family protein n=1 Tax=Pontixanthobacter rizhaonensis TaxID=2730337 RepID=A0A848QPW0_9SPHN|nr:UrcA family protein [Pontixanthobacter rizhaonensis]NMW32683.1 UrcA family protein [Pontixanthobacter rizhaonensis]